jgi:hypothetical protein
LIVTVAFPFPFEELLIEALKDCENPGCIEPDAANPVIDTLSETDKLAISESKSEHPEKETTALYKSPFEGLILVGPVEGTVAEDV